jgi:hypothetical protein
VRADYLDVSEPNIHPVWETTILLWLEKLPWLKARTPPDFEQKTRRSLAEYFATKPWARRVHPSLPAESPQQAADTPGAEELFHPPDLEMSKQRMEEYQLD